MNHPYKEWLVKDIGLDKLPRGAFFNKKQRLVKELAHHVHHAHPLYLLRLHDGLGHYLDIIGMSQVNTTEPDELDKDVIRFSHLIRQDAKGNPVFSDTECARFMDDVWSTGYKQSLCFARLYRPDAA